MVETQSVRCPSDILKKKFLVLNSNEDLTHRELDKIWKESDMLGFQTEEEMDVEGEEQEPVMAQERLQDEESEEEQRLMGSEA